MTPTLQRIEKLAMSGLDSLAITRQVYFLLPTHAFQSDPDRHFQVYQAVADFFEVPFQSIQIVGSAKTGISLIKQTPFDPLKSDIDIAVVDQSLFMRYSEIALEISSGLTRRDVFPSQNGRSVFNDYSRYVSKGMFRPDLMPYCPARGQWLSFFGKLSSVHSDFCAGMSAAIYASSKFFEWKQRVAIEKYLSECVPK